MGIRAWAIGESRVSSLTVCGRATDADAGLVNDTDVSHTDAAYCVGAQCAAFFCFGDRDQGFCAGLIL